MSEVDYSKDYWDIVFDQLGRKRLFKLALAALALLYASAIYAPLIANDRPFVLEAVNYKEYERALKTLFFASLGLQELVGQTPVEFLERTQGSDQTYAEAIGAERRAIGGGNRTRGSSGSCTNVWRPLATATQSRISLRTPASRSARFESSSPRTSV